MKNERESIKGSTSLRRRSKSNHAVSFMGTFGVILLMSSIGVKAENAQNSRLTHSELSNHYETTASYSIESVAPQQSNRHQVSGTVKDENGSPIPGVSIIIKGGKVGTTTDVDGHYNLSNVPTGAELEYSFVGMESQVVKVGAQESINIYLKEATAGLHEVVVTALGIKREQKALGYSMTELKGGDLNSSLINPVSALQGKVAGLQVEQSDGGMFGSTKILLRGVSTLNPDNQPIYVVDGVILDNSISNGGDPDWNEDSSDYGNELKNLNPDDFATVSVLKGAAATALYGSRGVNGAIVITTKNGVKNNRLGISLTQTFGIDYVYKQPHLQNEYGEGTIAGYVDYGETDTNGNYYVYDTERQFMTNTAGKHTLMGDGQGTSFGPIFDGSQIEYYDHTYRPYKADKNNFKDSYNLGFNSNTNVSISGGNDKTTFYNSLSYRYNSGTLPNNSFTRISLLSKASQKIGDKVKLDVSIAFANSTPKNAQPNISEHFTDGTFSRLYNPNWLKKKYAGSNGGIASDNYGDAYGDVEGTGLWWSIYRNSTVQKETEVRPTLTLTAELTDWLKFVAEGNYNYYYVRSETKQPGTGYDSQGGYYATGLYTKEQTNANATFFVDKTYGDWNIGGFLRGEYFNTMEETSNANTNDGLVAPNQYFIGNSKSTATYNTYISGQKRMLSVAGDVRAGWKNQVYIEVTGRNDWSSSLVYTDKHGTDSYFYPSVSGSWLINNTIKLPTWISFMKVRASWAQVGHDTQSYILNTAYSLAKSATANGTVYSLTLPSTIYDQNLKPERKNSLELGLDWRFLDSRINMDVAYYKDNTYHQIMPVSEPQESGISSQEINAGNIQDQGVEIALNTIPYRTKDLEWNVDFTYTKNSNKIVSLSSQVADFIGLYGTDNYGNYRIESVAKVGSTYGLLMTDSKPKIDATTGLPLLNYSNSRRGAYYQRNGTVQSLGSMLPNFLGSVATGLRYKNFSLHASFDMRFGGYIACYDSRYGTAYGYTKSSLAYRDTKHGGATWTSKWDGLTYHDGVIPNGVIAGGTVINQQDGSTYTVANGGETYQALCKAGKVEPIHASFWTYFTNSWGNGVVNDSWVKKLNYIAFRELTLNYTVPNNFAKKLGASTLNLSLSGHDLGYLLNSMPNGGNPEAIRGTGAGEFRMRQLDPFTANYTLTINATF